MRSMSGANQAVPVDDLELGMYVSKLDRPWLETPFLFQGFTIKDAREIKELKRHCRFVYVHDTKPDPDAPPEPDSTGGSTTLNSAEQNRPASMIGRFASWILKRQKGQSESGDAYKDVVTLSVEWKTAKSVHEEAASLYTDVLEEIRQNGKLDLQVLDTVVSPMVESVLRNRDALAWLSRMRQTDDYTYGHSVSCSIYAIAFGRHLGLPKEDLNLLGLGALLLDVGKTRISKELLATPDKLTPEQIQLMRQHVGFGMEILQDQPNTVDNRVLSMVQSHHERYDGSGYPDKLTGLDIPVFARIAGIVDYYDAVIRTRPYAKPVSCYDAVRSLNKLSGTEFQPEMVEQFVQAVGMFPNGALVELSTGEVGVILEQNRVRRLRPKVLVLLGADKKPMKKSKEVDLRKLPADRGSRGAVWLERGLEMGAYGIDAAEYFL